MRCWGDSPQKACPPGESETDSARTSPAGVPQLPREHSGSHSVRSLDRPRLPARSMTWESELAAGRIPKSHPSVAGLVPSCRPCRIPFETRRPLLWLRRKSANPRAPGTSVAMAFLHTDRPRRSVTVRPASPAHRSEALASSGETVGRPPAADRPTKVVHPKKAALSYPTAGPSCCRPTAAESPVPTSPRSGSRAFLPVIRRSFPDWPAGPPDQPWRIRKATSTRHTPPRSPKRREPVHLSGAEPSSSSHESPVMTGPTNSRQPKVRIAHGDYMSIRPL